MAKTQQRALCSHAIYTVHTHAYMYPQTRQDVPPLFFNFWLHLTACGTLVPQTRDQTCTPCTATWTLNPWTLGEVTMDMTL